MYYQSDRWYFLGRNGAWGYGGLGGNLLPPAASRPAIPGQPAPSTWAPGMHFPQRTATATSSSDGVATISHRLRRRRHANLLRLFAITQAATAVVATEAIAGAAAVMPARRPIRSMWSLVISTSSTNLANTRTTVRLAISV